MLSKVGEKLSELSGVRKIMNDIKKTIKESKNKKVINMSAGNPLVLDELIELWVKHTKKVVNSKEFGNIIGRYGSTKGYEKFLDSLVLFFEKNFSKKINHDNLLVSAGSQSLYFYAVNSFAGKMQDGTNKKIFLPQCPEYTGYVGMALQNYMFISRLQKIEKTKKHRFRYKIDSKNFPDKKEIGAIFLSRPCNPTGNVISDQEMEEIYKYVEGTDIPIFIDGAYSPPIPNLSFIDMKITFHPNVIFCMSFSKAGLPGERIGVAMGDPKYLKVLEAFQANSSIMSSRFGQSLISSALDSGELIDISKNVINPYYKKKFEFINACLDKFMPDDVSWYLHEGLGSMFSFIWFENLPIKDDDLYELIKEKGVLFVPGNSFFNGIDKSIKHTKECIRISITVSDEEIKEAIKILGEVIREVYK